MKGLGKALGLKGKDLFHPVRLAVTGRMRMSGPDIGEQLQLLAMAEGMVREEFSVVSLKDRIQVLQNFSLQATLQLVADRQAIVSPENLT